MKKNLLTASILIAALGAICLLHACTPSYPREKLPEAVKTICETEYGMDVDVAVAGNTMGIYYPMQGLLNVGMGISDEAWDTISNLVLIASRVTLSTDADIYFYCVVAQDARLPELQVVIIKYVDDVKRGMMRNISRNESFKRTIFSLNLTPQAKKERSIEKVFDKLNIEGATREKVMDEFFRSPPTKLSDIGYWRDNFYLKDITMEEFLSEQIANRIKLEFTSNKELAKIFMFKASECTFIPEGDLGYFVLAFKIADQDPGAGIAVLNRQKIEEILTIANTVLDGYKFKKFSSLIMDDQLRNARLTVNRDNLLNFKKKRLSVKETVQAPYGYF
ncbi:MAG: hypothetical protein HQ594_02540 [Candidatus Omnitrophica bacterium]|nr:hypothetical protein [Candidatus Omnitrophota bacterium]